MGLLDSGAAMGLVGSATLKRISARVAQFGLAVEPLPGRPRVAAGIGGEAAVLGARKVPIAAPGVPDVRRIPGSARAFLSLGSLAPSRTLS